jgi:lipopolysaccharide/colanic/teichoic acid biosynthesis glycosyltransferase
LIAPGTPGALLGAPDDPGRAPDPAPPAPPAAAKTDWQTLAPRGFYARRGQRLLSLACVIAGLPAALCVAAPIALANLILFRDPKKILFGQPRVGQRGRVFRILKFRTMSEPQRTSFDSWSAGEDAARVTRFGRLLRNTHLDELPQVINILRGEMSLVGPRPEMIEIHTWAKEHVTGFERRLALLPGLTGRAQVTQGYAGRRVEAYARKLAADDEYRIRFSLAEDARILAMTVGWVLRGRVPG